MDTTSRKLALVPDRVEAAKVGAEQTIRAALHEILSMPVHVSRREATGGRQIALSLSADQTIELLRERRKRNVMSAGPITGYDVFAAMLLDTATSGLARVQAMKLIVEMLEPITRTLELPSGGVSFVFGDGTAREASEVV